MLSNKAKPQRIPVREKNRVSQQHAVSNTNALTVAMIFLVLYSAFFTWLTNILILRQSLTLTMNIIWINAFITGYLFTIPAMIWTMQLPVAYMLINLIPLWLLLKLNYPASATNFRQLLIINFLFMGIIYPLTIYMQKLTDINNQYQKANLAVINTLLLDHTDYIAGIELIYNKTQPIAGLRHLMGPAIDYLYVHSEKIRPVMTAALYEDPNATAASVILALQHSHVKFYVNNYRINALPLVIKKYLASQYQHLWGSIYIYAPLISSGRQTTEIKFSGNYTLQIPRETVATINGTTYHNGERIKLTAEIVNSTSAAPFRLALTPDETSLPLDPTFKQDEWEKMIF